MAPPFPHKPTDTLETQGNFFFFFFLHVVLSRQSAFEDIKQDFHFRVLCGILQTSVCILRLLWTSPITNATE